MKFFLVLLISLSTGYSAQLRHTEAYTIHPHKQSVTFYSNEKLTHRRMTVFGYEEEGGAGVILQILGETETGLLVYFGGEYMYVKKGKLGTTAGSQLGGITQLLYGPDETSDVVFSFDDVRIVRVVGWTRGWLKVQTTDGLRKVTGWISESLVCPSPYTTCP